MVDGPVFADDNGKRKSSRIQGVKEKKNRNNQFQ
jgi:hypothetical protein